MEQFWFMMNLFLDMFPFMTLTLFVFRKELKYSLPFAILCEMGIMISYHLLMCVTYYANLYNSTVIVVLRLMTIVLAWIILSWLFKGYYLQFLYKCLISLPFMLHILNCSALCINLVNTDTAPEFMYISIFRFLFTLVFGYLYYLIEAKILIPSFEIKDKKIWILFIVSQLCLNTAMLLHLRNDYARNGVSLSDFSLQMIMSVVTILVSIIVVHTCSLAKKMQLAEEKERQNALLIDLNKKQYDTLQANIKDMNRIHHDFRHHVHVLSESLSGGNVPDAMKYLASLSEQLPETTSITFCENLLINALLSHYFEKAKANNIDVSFDCNQLSDCTIEETDLTILLGNAIENAIEASLDCPIKDRYIKLKATHAMNSIYLTLDNSFDGHIMEKEGALLSKKRNYETSGFGNISINAVVEKYHGDIQRSITNNSYQISIALSEIS